MEDEEEKELILVIEDTANFNDYITQQLKKNGYDIVQCYGIEDASIALSNNYFSLVLLDLNLDGEDGMQILKKIRLQNKFLPVMIVSSIQDEKTKVEGFASGCDDFITKPFYMEELLQRIKRMITRLSYMSYEKKAIKTIYSSGIFEINTESRTLTKNNIPIPVRKKQFDIMLYFIQHPNVVLSFSKLYSEIWDSNSLDNEDPIKIESNIYVNIHSLRTLIEDDPKNPHHLVSFNRTGYMFIPN